MAWKLSDLIPKKAGALRLNAGEAASTMLEVDGGAAPLDEMINALEAERAASAGGAGHCMTASDDDEVEKDGRKYKVGELRNAYRNSLARKNAEDKEKSDKEKRDRENAAKAKRANDVQLSGAGKGSGSKLAGAGSDKIDCVEDNPDAALAAAKEISTLKDRLNSMNQEIASLKSAPSRELREAANLRFAPVGGEPQDRGFVTMEDRIRAGNAEFALNAGE